MRGYMHTVMDFVDKFPIYIQPGGMNLYSPTQHLHM